jgi:deoxyribodipyrimidine photo-lyase
LKRKTTNIVWLKRDLRSQDHEPLLKAEAASIPYRIIYLFEPSMIAYLDTSLRHLQFVYQSIIALNKTLNQFNREVDIFYGEAIDVFNYLGEKFDIRNLFSHRESGTQITWQRDKTITNFCRVNNIRWFESQRDGILRGIKNRTDWNKQWHITMHQPVIENRYSYSNEEKIAHPFPIPDKLEKQLQNYPKEYQPAGEKNAWRYLVSFATARGFKYQKAENRVVAYLLFWLGETSA